MTEATRQIGGISAEDRTLAILTHLSGLAGYIIPLGGIVVPIVIWLVKSENKTIAAIARQAIILNVAIFICVVTFVLLMLTVILIPVSVLAFSVLSVVAVVLPIVGAVKASDGEYYAYPVVGSVP